MTMDIETQNVKEKNGLRSKVQGKFQCCSLLLSLGGKLQYIVFDSSLTGIICRASGLSYLSWCYDCIHSLKVTYEHTLECDGKEKVNRKVGKTLKPFWCDLLLGESDL